MTNTNAAPYLTWRYSRVAESYHLEELYWRNLMMSSIRNTMRWPSLIHKGEFLLLWTRTVMIRGCISTLPSKVENLTLPLSAGSSSRLHIHQAPDHSHHCSILVNSSASTQWHFASSSAASSNKSSFKVKPPCSLNICAPSLNCLLILFVYMTNTNAAPYLTWRYSRVAESYHLEELYWRNLMMSSIRNTMRWPSLIHKGEFLLLWTRTVMIRGCISTLPSKVENLTLPLSAGSSSRLHIHQAPDHSHHCSILVNSSASTQWHFASSSAASSSKNSFPFS